MSENKALSNCIRCVYSYWSAENKPTLMCCNASLAPESTIVDFHYLAKCKLMSEFLPYKSVVDYNGIKQIAAKLKAINNKTNIDDSHEMSNLGNRVLQQDSRKV